jgi:prepilin-type N-terminal cleavage/methylation domain-containing protein
MRQTRRGFTLIELMVVIAIIGILAGIALPVLDRVKSGANRTKCITNLKNIGVAVSQWNASFGKRMNWPSSDQKPLGYDYATQDYNLRYMECLYQGSNPILESTELLSCPSNSDDIPNVFEMPRAPNWNFDIGKSAYLFVYTKNKGPSYNVPRSGSRLSTMLLAGDRAPNHEEGPNILFYNMKVMDFDRDTFENLYRYDNGWEDPQSKVTDKGGSKRYLGNFN